MQPCLFPVASSITYSLPSKHLLPKTYRHNRTFGSLPGESCHAKNEGKGLELWNLFGGPGSKVPEWLQGLCFRVSAWG